MALNEKEKRPEMKIRFSNELQDALRAESERLGIPVNAIVVVALDQWLHQRGKL